MNKTCKVIIKEEKTARNSDKKQKKYTLSSEEDFK